MVPEVPRRTNSSTSLPWLVTLGMQWSTPTPTTSACSYIRSSGEIAPQNQLAAEVLKFAARTHGQQNQLAVIANMKGQKEANSALAGGICAAVLFFFITKAAIFDMDWSTYPGLATIIVMVAIVLIDILIIAGIASAVHTKMK